jgi:hypothetical protein
MVSWSMVRSRRLAKWVRWQGSALVAEVLVDIHRVDELRRPVLVLPTAVAGYQVLGDVIVVQARRGRC